MLSRQPALFQRVFQLAFSSAAGRLYQLSSEGRDQDIQQRMYRDMSTTPFKSQYNMLTLRMDEDTEVARLKSLNVD